MTWLTNLLGDTARPLDAGVSVANVTGRPMLVRWRMTFSTGRTRTQSETVSPGRTWSTTIRALFGVHVSDPEADLAGLTVTCDGGATACPVLWTRLVSPACEGAQ
ncbi:hypothetical protein [Luteitalea sp.]|uniref:hypothetical protein n=1 Tax=Luteitalea sp. TaxID=2004800 RepID=UPI0025B9E2E1|nr:hypothetical protein [Luteitalea sp.]